MSEFPLSKVCTKCRIEKPFDEFPADKRHSSGKSPRCRLCTQAYYAKKAQQPKDVPEAKECLACGLTKEISAFGIDKYTTDGKASRCLDCKREASTNYRGKNPEKGAIATAAWRANNPEKHQESVERGREKKNKRRRELYLEQKDKENAQAAAWYISNRAARKLTMKAWDLANPGYQSRKGQRRRARKRNLPDTWTAEQQAFMHSYWQHACAACGNQEGLWWTLASDHWVPITSPNCPGTVCTNMVPLCDGQGGCNTSKRDTDAHVWLLRRFGKSKAAKIEKAIATYFAIVAERFGTVSAPTERSL